jgi:hypothetical protein
MLHAVLELICGTVMWHAGHAIDVQGIVPSRKVSAGLVDEACEDEGPSQTEGAGTCDYAGLCQREGWRVLDRGGQHQCLGMLAKKEILTPAIFCHYHC